MSVSVSKEEERLFEQTLGAARDTRVFAAEEGIRHRAAQIFEPVFGSQPAMIVADRNTFAAAGRDVVDSFRRANRACTEPFVFSTNISADYQHVEAIEAALRPGRAIPVAVGSGTINDLTKLASHRAERQYMVVATAASMDGYTAFGAAITRNGAKQTMQCPGPLVALADLEVIGRAPKGMNSSGYADLLAKIAAGADWILAEAAGEEQIIPLAWHAVQDFLRSWVGSPEGVAQNDPACIRHLLNGLVMSGAAMQIALSSRPASGAEHQFSHLWEMQHVSYNDYTPSHGVKVGIGTLAAVALYEELFTRDFTNFDIGAAVRAWPAWESEQARIAELFGAGPVATRAIEETQAKYVSREKLAGQLTNLCAAWTGLRERLAAQLIPFVELRRMLRAAGCAFDPAQIGISRSRLRLSYRQCCYMRRRFTVLDFAQRTGLLDSCLDNLFSPGGAWSAEGEEH